MKIPKSVTVGGKTYKVLFPYVFTERTDICGQADHVALEIRLSSLGANGDELARENIEEVFMHEVVHCVDKVYNNNALNEETTDRLGQGLYQALRDSGMLVD